MVDYTDRDWIDKVSHISQVGGIETAVLDNGPGKGTRIAWINTGSGLRFKVVIDRAMDIAEAYFNASNLTWISALGVTSPQPLADRGTDWLRTFTGGLVTTCGLTHAGGPDEDQSGARGLHDRIANTPAEIIHIKQPDPKSGDMEMAITGRMFQGQALGYKLELLRTIHCRLGEPTLRITDEVRNIGNTKVPHMLLYHLNFGWPFIDKGTRILWRGDWKSREPEEAQLFTQQHDFRTCPAPLESHRGSGEEAAFIDVQADTNGIAHCGAYNPHLGLAVHVAFPKKQLPWLTNWQHWGPGEYVMGLEPGTNPPIGQVKARENNQLIELEPNESKLYNLDISVINDSPSIDAFVQSFNKKENRNEKEH